MNSYHVIPVCDTVHLQDLCRLRIHGIDMNLCWYDICKTCAAYLMRRANKHIAEVMMCLCFLRWYLTSSLFRNATTCVWWLRACQSDYVGEWESVSCLSGDIESQACVQAGKTCAVWINDAWWNRVYCSGKIISQYYDFYKSCVTIFINILRFVMKLHMFMIIY